MLAEHPASCITTAVLEMQAAPATAAATGRLPETRVCTIVTTK
jgi:hypothetical protein